MLLVEWQAWWEHLPAIAATEWLDGYRMALTADSGWTMNREPILADKEELAARATARRPAEESVETADPADPWGLRKTVRRVFAWLKTEYGGGVGQG